MSNLQLAISQISASAVSVSAGTAYVFSLYGPQLAEKLQLGQSEVAFIASCSNLGNYFSGPIAGCACYQTSLVTNYGNWPAEYRSIAIGMTVSFFGLSAFIFAFIGSNFFAFNKILLVSDFLTFLGTLCLIINLFAVVLLKPLPIDATEEEMEPLLHDGDIETEYTTEEYEQYASPVIQDELDLVHEHSIGIELEEISCFRSMNAYFLALNMLFVVGVGLMYTNNVGAIVISLLPDGMTSKDPLTQALQKSHVSILSLTSFGARIATGFLADICAQRYNIQRTVWAIFSAGFMTLGCLIALYISNVDDLYAVTVLIAIAYGSTWTVIPILVGEYFGQKNFSKNW
ncbi:hypothetical protein HK103_002105 [Boothiomyces macroporosus]|uniref:Nodulin-like domain-containing protein n=1 Tax=Boothiomyces macroporosus TaxID=261099 RepID=A0AAD5UND8_9FUNG|nr:hypothetical protein HK103_002105 [Boothiomyces macroporosus]